MPRLPLIKSQKWVHFSCTDMCTVYTVNTNKNKWVFKRKRDNFYFSLNIDYRTFSFPLFACFGSLGLFHLGSYILLSVSSAACIHPVSWSPVGPGRVERSGSSLNWYFTAYYFSRHSDFHVAGFLPCAPNAVSPNQATLYLCRKLYERKFPSEFPTGAGIRKICWKCKSSKIVMLIRP
jgi:hypothetical protein